MVRLLALLTVVPAFAWAQTVSAVGDVVVISDPTGAITNLLSMNNGSILPSHQEQFCRAAYNAMRTALPDEYDGIISFSATDNVLSDLENTWQGSPVRAAAGGIGRQDAPWANTYNGQRISQCVFMGALGRTTSFIGGGTEALPADPDAAWSPSLGLPIPGVSSLSGIEMVGHEYGHHWLLGVEYDKADGRGKQHSIRGFAQNSGEGSTDPGHPNQHYSHLADSRSVMYGECITDKGGGTYHLGGCARKYSHLDQYLMGLREPADVTPMMVLEDPASPGQGQDVIAMGASSSGQDVSGLVRYDVGAQDIIRAMGGRTPDPAQAKHCWNVAFVVVLAPGQTALPPAMAQKVERYRARWGPWFQMATDGRGTMETRIGGTACLTSPDAGVDVPPDAGESPVDAGSGTEPDAGSSAADGGGGPQDAGSGRDEILGTGKLKPGCGCGAADGSLAVAGLLLVGALAQRRRRSLDALR